MNISVEVLRRQLDILGDVQNPGVCLLPKFLCRNLIPAVMVFGAGAFWKQLGHEFGALW